MTRAALKSALLRAFGRPSQAPPWNDEQSIREELFSIERLEQHAESLEAAQHVAHDLGVHRVYLARVFRLQFGCSPREYVQHLRVRAAAHQEQFVGTGGDGAVTSISNGSTWACPRAYWRVRGAEPLGKKRARRDSNPRPTASKAGALSN